MRDIDVLYAYVLPDSLELFQSEHCQTGVGRLCVRGST